LSIGQGFAVDDELDKCSFKSLGASKIRIRGEDDRNDVNFVKVKEICSGLKIMCMCDRLVYKQK